MKPDRLVAAAFSLLVLLVGSSALAQETGRVKGRVLDDYNAVTLPGAPVEVVGTGTVVYSDMDGAFDIDLAPGTYDVRVSFSGYDESVSLGVVVAAGETTELVVVLKIGTVELAEEITVTAEAAPLATSQAAALLERKKSGTVSDGLAREEMKANADTDASEAMTRVTGVSVVGGQYVYVRGLGERYSNTTLNGSVLPTTEPDKRVVPLDLFPTALLESVKVTKSYMPDKPAEFSGGLLEIEPINFPDGPVLSISASGGYNSNTTGKDGLTYPGGSTDWLGFDDGRRALPDVIPEQKVVPAGRFGGGYTQDELTAFGQAFENVWESQETTGKPDSSFSILAGNSWDKLGAVGCHHLQLQEPLPGRAAAVLRAGRGAGGPAAHQRLRLPLLDLPGHPRCGGEPGLSLLRLAPGGLGELLYQQRPGRGAAVRRLPGGQGRSPRERPGLLDPGDDLLQQGLGRALLPERLQQQGSTGG